MNKTPNLPTSFIDMFLCLFIVFQVLNVITPSSTKPTDFYELSINSPEFLLGKEKIIIEFRLDNKKFDSFSDYENVKWIHGKNTINAIFNFDTKPSITDFRIKVVTDHLELLKLNKIKMKIIWNEREKNIWLLRDKYFNIEINEL